MRRRRWGRVLAGVLAVLVVLGGAALWWVERQAAWRDVPVERFAQPGPAELDLRYSRASGEDVDAVVVEETPEAVTVVVRLHDPYRWENVTADGVMESRRVRLAAPLGARAVRTVGGAAVPGRRYGTPVRVLVVAPGRTPGAGARLVWGLGVGVGDDGCVRVGNWLAVWPAGTAWDAARGAVRLPGGAPIHPGDQVQATARTVAPDALGAWTVPPDAAAACDPGGRVLVVGPDVRLRRPG